VVAAVVEACDTVATASVKKTVLNSSLAADFKSDNIVMKDFVHPVTDAVDFRAKGDTLLVSPSTIVQQPGVVFDELGGNNVIRKSIIY